jgi:hypothetical protein
LIRERIQKPLEQSGGVFVEASAVREGIIAINARGAEALFNAWNPFLMNCPCREAKAELRMENGLNTD